MNDTDEILDFLQPGQNKNATQDEEEKHKLPGLFDYINDLSFKKENLANKVMQETGKFPSEFVPFIAVKTFGNYKDTIFLANEMNIHFSEIPPESQYAFYLNGIPKKKRFSKFYSADTFRETALSALSKYYKWGRRESESNIKMFNKDELTEIIRRISDDNRMQR